MTTTAEAAADASLTAHIKFTNISGLITMHVLPNHNNDYSSLCT